MRYAYEDFDVMAPGKAETVQVKETKKSGSVTLRSKEVREAIAHFWEHQNNNPDVKVEFHFLTTSERGKEQGSRGSFAALRLGAYISAMLEHNWRQAIDYGHGTSIFGEAHDAPENSFKNTDD